MKKIAIFSLVAVMAMAAVSCQKEDLTNGPVFKASSPNFASKDGKTVFDGTNTFRWKNKDRIHVWDAAGNHKLYNAVCNDGDAYATLTPKGTYVNTSSGLSTNASPIYGNLALNSTYRAIYPDFYADTTVSNPGQVTITIPQTQAITNQESDPVGSDNGLHLTRFPSYCQSNSTTMPFKNLCGALKLILQADNTYIESIKFTSKTNGLPVAGTFTINWNNGDPILTPATGNNCYSTTLSYAVKQSIDHPHAFWLCLPAGYYSDYEIEITNSNYEKCYISSHGTIPIEIARSEYTVMRLDNNQISTHFESGDGIFSVSATKRVYFSPGNLQCVNNHWQFAEEQYQVIHPAGYSEQYNPVHDFQWDLFGWSTSGPNEGSDYGTKVGSDYYYQANNFKEYGLVFGESSPWETMSRDEWVYLLNTRQMNLTINGTSYSDKRYIKLKITDNQGWYQSGLLLFPDEVSITTGSGISLNMYDFTTCTIEQFKSVFESAGCIFLPYAGYCQEGTFPVQINNYQAGVWGYQMGWYWTSTDGTTSQAWGGQAHAVDITNIAVRDNQNKDFRYAVRLVRQVPNQSK